MIGKIPVANRDVYLELIPIGRGTSEFLRKPNVKKGASP
jgi:hypothetical protein